MKNVPKLRFNGFSDEWEEKKLGDCIKYVSSGKTKVKADNGNYKVFGSTGVIGYTNEADYNGEHILIARVGANAGYINKINEVCGISDNTLVLKCDDNLNYEFLSYKLDEFNLSRLIFGSGQPLITGGQIKDLKFKLPKIKEQEKIANFLTKVDKLIEKQDEKVSNLEQYKKGMMQKIFSQEIRFKKDDGGEYPEWEKSTFEKVLIEDLHPVDKPSERYEKLSVRSHAKGTFSSLVEKPDEVAMDTLYEVKENQLIVNITFAWEHAIAIVKKEDEGKLVSHRFPTYKFSDSSSYKFFGNYIKMPIIKYKLGLASPGGAGRNRVLNKSEFLKIEVPLPCLDEQIKIANLLSKIDFIVDKEKEKLEEMRMWKKGLLQGMFV